VKPLEGVKVLDFSTLLPGPLASLFLAEAGADVLKIERPGHGDEMRIYTPKFGTDSINFALLNRGKRSLAIDLKAKDAIAQLTPLIREADILLEQFRPGTLDRLGLGYDALAKINPGLIYCSITGYGPSGPLAQVAAHDLNFCAETGVLSLAAGTDGTPGLPALLVGDIAGGTLPAVLNILLALRQRDKTGTGCKLDITMADNLFTLMYWAIGEGAAAGKWPYGGSGLVTGGSPRYNIYRTADDRFLAAAPLEDKFWNNFCDVIGLAADERNDTADPQGVKQAAAALIRRHTAEEWQRRFEGKDVCCNVVVSLKDAMSNPHFRERKLFDWTVEAEGKTITALPVPIAAQFRGPPDRKTYPTLGESNAVPSGKRD